MRILSSQPLPIPDEAVRVQQEAPLPIDFLPQRDAESDENLAARCALEREREVERLRHPPRRGTRLPYVTEWD